MNRQASTTYRKTIIAIHVAVWLVVFLAPLTFFNRGDRFEAEKLVPMISYPLAMMAVFYTMYLHITPRYFFAQDRRRFWILTVALVVTVGVLLHLWMNFTHGLFPKTAEMMHHIPPEHHIRMDVWMIPRNISSMAVAAAIATMSIITMRWQEAETARQEAELARQKADTARADAELKNLRNQINPHFLLNTLNNIYALTAFDPTRAQEAIMQLSGMLRHILYDNQQDYVPLNNEVKFILSYVNLMKMRLTKSCDVKVDVDVAEQNNIKVAPLIFISLIENAFKHGIAAEGKSFIHINIKADNEKIACCIENSNHPKKQTDRSGHGIGLEQVGRRLELAYPGKYLWEKGVKENESIYYSKIIIYDTELRDY